MTAPNPRAFFPWPIAKISCKKVGVWEERQRSYRPYFDTWAEAHAYMLAQAMLKAQGAERALKSAKRHLANVRAMQPKESP
jgi:hypothetical protein